MSDETGAAGRGGEERKEPSWGQLLWDAEVEESRRNQPRWRFVPWEEVQPRDRERYERVGASFARAVAAVAVEAERERGAALREALRAYLDDPTFPPLPSQTMRLDAAGTAYDGEADKAAAVLACADEWEKDGR